MNMTLFRLCALSVLIAVVSSAGLKEEFTWTILNYIWPGTDRRVEERVSRRQIDNVFEDPNISVEAFVTRDAPEGVEFIPENNIPMGANVWKNKLFITVPRRQPGIPSTLNYVPLDSPNRHNVPLIPYPNLEINRYPGGRQNFLSVYRVAIDPCDRLWMADTGLIETPGNSSQVKASMIFVIDLNTDQVIHSYEIPTSFMRPASLLDSITIDVTENTCDDAYAYLPDLGGYSIIVYSLKQNRSWRVAHNYLFLENSQGDFNIHGHRFQWNDGVFNVELSSIKPTGFRDLYFHALAGSHLYRVSTRILRNETLATRSFHADDFQTPSCAKEVQERVTTCRAVSSSWRSSVQG
ncbi:unnamed protein product [Phaedon cochleariae]|uniref:Yellow-like protein n=1 Tax=Phaedon cochleariae TaxID=80249 RepID=A0A9P0GJS5_PHACE|nr:unnamed protein product [Phaedon cochleariae]